MVLEKEMDKMGITDQAIPPEVNPTPSNATMLQGFEWYVQPGGEHWRRLNRELKKLHDVGITALWIPPPCKASSAEGNGYDIYDLYDLGEFDQKGSKATKWGTKEDLDELAKNAKDLGVKLYIDAVLNHKAAADEVETFKVIEVDANDRTKYVSDEHDIDGYTKFTFPGRNGKYSDLVWHHYHFTGVDYDDKSKKTAIYKISGDNKGWAQGVDGEKGNFDYLMFSDIDHKHPEVADDIKKWGVWVAKELNLGGFRFDAVKHFDEDFLRDFVKNVDENYHDDLFVVGEFWKDSLQDMHNYLDRMNQKFSLFDAPLVYNFSQASKTESFDLTKIFNDTLVQTRPVSAVTLVMNHDTQPNQALQAPIEGFFKPLAYSLILFRVDGYPCIFYGDLFGISGDQKEDPACGGALPDFILARKLYAYGEQNDYFDYPTCVGWVRRGTWDRPDGLAVVISNAGPGQKHMFVGELHKGEKWTDVLGWSQNEITIGEDGFADFNCPATSVSIWVNKEAKGREFFGQNHFKI